LSPQSTGAIFREHYGASKAVKDGKKDLSMVSGKIDFFIRVKVALAPR